MALQSNNSPRPIIEAVGNRCCGCGACVAICPAGCLSSEHDELGFLYPHYTNECIDCGKCREVCPTLNQGSKRKTVNAFWAKAIDDDFRERSSSGAIFGVIAQKSLEQGGVVYGAAFDKDQKRVEHIRVDRVKDLEKIMRSKYVQSCVDKDLYDSIADDLRSGKKVIFSGTACQCDGLGNYLNSKKIPTDNLLLIDVICHGVPSPAFWKKWIKFVSSGAGAEIDEVNFRSKSTGWLTYSVAYHSATEKVISIKNNEDWYMRAFLNNASLRESCFNCPSKGKSISDITLGDFWGIQNYHPDVIDNLGVSAVICNSEKGVDTIRSIQNEIQCGDSSFDEISAGNPSLVASVKPYPERHEFLNDVDSGMSISQLMSKWKFEPSLKQKVRGKLSAVKHRVSKSK